MEDWMVEAVCRDYDPELFFPVGTSGPAVGQIAEAKAVCRGCPVAAECLGFALRMGETDGVWGGMSEDERRALSRRTPGRVRVDHGFPEGSCQAGTHSRTRVYWEGGRERCHDCVKEARSQRDARRAMAMA